MNRFPSRSSPWPFWLDLGMLSIWGILLLKYWVTDQIVFLLHPNFIGLTVGTGLVFLFMAGFRLRRWLDEQKSRSRGRQSTTTLQHLSLFPPGWSTMLLILTAMVGLLYTPQPFTSDIALRRGVADMVMVTQAQPQAFRTSSRPEERSITDWVRTLNVYPEPDAYAGQAVDVSGFAIHPPDLPNNYIIISRFILTCCAADAYPVGLPVKLASDRADYPADQWFRIKGEMATENLNDTRRLTVVADGIESIPVPKNPYDY
ncbi:MAG: TIGR03943 family protein [Merismopedia sp. SIO2A8]|nr:TIGR03943 family protein [Merismopedia sp. SIO2A8]